MANYFHLWIDLVRSPTLGLQFSGLKWSSTSEKTEGGSAASSESKTIAVSSNDLIDAYIWASAGKFNVYVYPFQDSNAFFTIGYMIEENLEIAVDFGYNSVKTDEPESLLARTLYGLSGTYYLAVGPWTFENNLLFDLSTGLSRRKDPATGAEFEDSTKGNFGKLAVTGLYPIATNIWYYGSVGFSAQNDKSNSGQTERFKQLALTFAGIRVSM